MRFFTSRAARLASALLLAEAALFYGFPKAELPRGSRPLQELPLSMDGWRMMDEIPTDAETLRVLRADDTLNRNYAAPGGGGANLFLAFFKTQSTGVAPHSPRNCLPGAGWTKRDSQIVELQVPGVAQPLRVNRYVIEKGAAQAVVIYWYQTGSRAIASEYEAKVRTFVDRIRERRSDVALVRVVASIDSGGDQEAEQRAQALAKAAYGPLTALLPQ